MKKKVSIITAGLSLALTAMAAPLTPGEALQRLQSTGVMCKAAKTLSSDQAPVYTAKTEDGMPAAYIFNIAGGGYVIAGGDDVAYPVLGYSESGCIDRADISPEMMWWLSEYASQIEYASKKDASSANSPEADASMHAVAPLVKTKWDQGEPYYNDCPVPRGSSRPCYSGCVATSMAQVMKYHNYPEMGEGTIRYSTTIEGVNRTLTLNLRQKAFDWANMLDVYNAGEYTEVQAAAVAYLMKACGYSVNMMYGLNSSGAGGAVIANALTDYFKYDKNCRTVMRTIYSSDEWTNLIYEELKNSRPIVLNGQTSSQGGHSFVIDGYDGKGYFHVNWGWSGMSDGYFSLDALNPDAQGIGGFIGGFNFSQNAIIGIQPPTDEPALPMPGGLYLRGTAVASISGKTVTFDLKDVKSPGWGTIYNKSVNLKLGAIVTPVDGTSGEQVTVDGKLGTMSEISLSSVYSYFAANQVKFTVDMPALAGGKYKITIASMNLGEPETGWVPAAVMYGLQNSALLTVEDGIYSVEALPVSYIGISDLEMMQPAYCGKNVFIKAKMTNSGNEAISNGVCPILKNAAGRTVYEGEAIIVSLNPGETIEKEWVSKFYTPGTGALAALRSETEFTLSLYNPDNGIEYNNVSTKVSLLPNPGNTTFRLTGFSIQDSEKIEMEVNGIHYYTVYTVSSLSTIPVDLSFDITRGFFDGQIVYSIMEQNPSNPNLLIPVKEDVFKEQFFVGAGEQKNVRSVIDFSEGEENHLYFIQGKYTLDFKELILGQFAFISNPSGVEDIIADDMNEPVEYFNLQGVRIDNPDYGELVIVKRGSDTKKVIYNK